MPISAPFFGIRLPKKRMRKNDAAGISGMTYACSRNQPISAAQPFISATSSRSTLRRLR